MPTLSFDNSEKTHGRRSNRDDCRLLKPSTAHPLKIVADRKETCAMSAKRASIAQVMVVVAMAAVNLAVIRSMPLEVVTYPTIWVLLGTIDFVIFWKLIAKQSLRAFHYTFLIVFVVTYVIVALVVSMERVSLLGPLVRWYQTIAGVNTIRNSFGLLWIAEFWTACLLSFVFAYAIGAVAAWLERRRGWDIAAFWRRSFVGFGVFTVLMLIADAATGVAQPSSAQLIGRLVILAVCLILGGWLGVSRMKSSIADREVRQDQANSAPDRTALLP